MERLFCVVVLHPFAVILRSEAVPSGAKELLLVKQMPRKRSAQAPDLLFHAGRAFKNVFATPIGMPYYVYILSSRSRTLYTGITNNIVRRVAEHPRGVVPGFTSKYRIHRLVHVEPYEHPSAAIAREKQIKGWLRAKKVALIEDRNPT